MMHGQDGGSAGSTLVLGGTGFLGSRLTAALSCGGAEVAVIKAPQPSAAGRLEEDVRSALRRHRPTAVVSLLGSGTPAVRYPGYHEAKNVAPARALASALRSTDYRGTLLFASTGGVYGNTDHPVDEQAPVQPVTRYARAKLEAERILVDAAASVVIARLFQVYGEGQRKLVVYDLAHRVHNERGPLTLRSSGAEVRDLAHVEGVVGALRLLLSAADRPQHLVVNVATGVGTRIDDLARRLLDLAGHRGREVRPGPDGDQNPLKASIADVSKLRGLGAEVASVSDASLLGVLNWVAADAS